MIVAFLVGAAFCGAYLGAVVKLDNAIVRRRNGRRLDAYAARQRAQFDRQHQDAQRLLTAHAEDQHTGYGYRRPGE